MRKLILFINIFFSLQVAILAQNTILDLPVTIKQYNTTIEKVLAELRIKYGVKFSYVNNVVPLKKKVRVVVSNQPLRSGLDEIFYSTDIDYELINGQIVLHRNALKDKHAEPSLATSATMMEKRRETGANIKKISPKPLTVDSTTASASSINPGFAQIPEMDTTSIAKKNIAQASFLPGISTNGFNNSEMVNNFSINVLAGRSRGLEGVELGIGANFEKHYVKGGQFAGGFNIVNGPVFGGQFAGIFNYNDGYSAGGQFAGVSNVVSDNADLVQGAGILNIVKGPFNGVQFAGISNINGGFTTGFQCAGIANLTSSAGKVVQAAGFLNICKGGIEGGQASGFANFASGDIKGFQASGFINFARTTTGGQFAGFANISSGDLKGIQLSGFINISNKVKGSQIGVINISDTLTGVGIGVLNIVKKGYNRFEAAIDETAAISLAFKPGTSRLYNIFAITVQPWGNSFRWRLGYGIGTDISLSERRSLTIDGAVSHANNNEWWTSRLSFITQLKVLYNFNFSPRNSLFLGPTLNVHSFDKKYEENQKEVSPYSFEISDDFDVKVTGWIGITAGFRM